MLDSIWGGWKMVGGDVEFMPQGGLAADVDKNASVLKKGRQSRSEENQAAAKVHFPAIGKMGVSFFITGSAAGFTALLRGGCRFRPRG